MNIRLPFRHPPQTDMNEPPIRADLFGIERLEQHAESLAAAQQISDSSVAGVPLLARVKDNERILREVRRAIDVRLDQEFWITPAAQWLVDNFYVVAEQLSQIRTDLSVGFYRGLPKLAHGPFRGYPRVYGIAWAFVAHTDSHVDPEYLQAFLLAYQRVQPLTMGELWAAPIVLRVVLVENLRRLADAMRNTDRAQQEAEILAKTLLGTDTDGRSATAWAQFTDDRHELVPAFVVELMQRLRNHDPNLNPGFASLHQRLAAQGTTPEEITLLEHQRHAANAASVRNVITSMRWIAAFDWKVFFESVSLVDQALRAHLDYDAMDFVSRDHYRHAIEALARGANRPELEIAHEALARTEAARNRPTESAEEADKQPCDLGFYLIGEGRRSFERAMGCAPGMRLRLMRAFIDVAAPGYIGTVIVFTMLVLTVPILLAAHGGAPLTGWIVLGLLALIPASNLAVALVNREVTTLVSPAILPRFEWPNGVPTECRTIVAVPTLLTGLSDVRDQVEQLEVRYLGNADGEVLFALLSDWCDAPTEHLQGDEEILTAARDGIARLNARYGPTPGGSDQFFVLHRARRWNETDGVWMGWERKRGKLHELNRLLRGATDTSFLAEEGASIVPTGVRYVVTLDADTRLKSGTVIRLVGTLAHPLNQPEIDPESGRIVRGYAVLQPRVTPTLPLRSGSLFQRMSSTSAGIDPYSGAVSDVYQDLFGEGSYIGKGIYHLDAFEAALMGRVPENTLLSHDLFEGMFARTGLVTDIECFEAAPATYLGAAGRQRRWARGDWQLLPWILHHPFTMIARWKMLDNLRRTLLMPTIFLTLVVAWAWPGSLPVVWSAFVLAMLAIPPLIPALVGVLRWPRDSSARMHLRSEFRDLQFATANIGLAIAMIPHQAWLMADAIARTLWRLYVSHRHLLQWKAMEKTASPDELRLREYHGHMSGGLALVLVAASAAAWQPAAWPVAIPLLTLWILAPTIAYRISLPRRVAALPADEARYLRLVARRTWDYFTTFVTPASHALPPDNFQEAPQPVVAERTSPTNIGLYLLTVVSARDFGWIGTLDLVDRLEATLATVRGLQHYRGHLFNWYETSDCRPLEPRYVSSVDSGNLAGTLLTLSLACREMIDQPISRLAMFEGIEDAVFLLREAADSEAGKLSLAPMLGGRLNDALDLVLGVAARHPDTPVEWAERLSELDAAVVSAANLACGMGNHGGKTLPPALLAAAEGLRGAVNTHTRDLVALMPWALLRTSQATASAMASLAAPVALAGLPDLCEIARSELTTGRTELARVAHADVALRETDALINALGRSAEGALELIQRITRLADEARDMVTAMEFGFLFDPSRMLFSIGYRATDDTLDPGRYDLLASEARLLSYVAIAKGDVPADHWFRLGRPLGSAGMSAVLLSWSGSMFEYLMPRLLMHAPADSLLNQTYRLMLQRQIRYGTRHGIPWGISESGYYARDKAMTFQYSNFGVLGLGLRYVTGDDRVIAPYATGLATMVDPVAAANNFRALEAAGARGQYGFFEALDYTPERLPPDTSKAVVAMYMAHHQGMLVIAIGNVIHDGAMRSRFHAAAIVRAHELLLQEPMPHDVALVRPQVIQAAALGNVREMVPPHTRQFSTAHGTIPRTQLLSNGRYTVMLTAAGSGYSRWHDLAVTRWREDATRDDTGSYIYLCDMEGVEHWSAGFQPSGKEPDKYEVSFGEDRAEFVRRDGSIETRLEVIVASEDDAELRRVSIFNHGTRSRAIAVTSYAEIVLAPAATDNSHSAFSNLFVQTECLKERNTLLATRRPRSPDDSEIWLAHVLAVEGETIGNLEWETDRAQFLGRGRGVRAPQVEDASRSLSNATGPVLDPIVSLRRRVRIQPGKSVQLVYSTLVGPTRQHVLDLADKYHDVTNFERAITMSWTQARIELHDLGIEPDEARLFQSLAGFLLYVHRVLRAPAEVLMRQTEGVSALWAHGISGDFPIVLVQVGESEGIGIVRQLIRGHEYWQVKGLEVDLVIFNDRPPSYVQDLQTLIDALATPRQTALNQEGQRARGKIFTLRIDHVTPGQRDVLESVARVILSNRDGSLAAQVARVLRSDSSALAPPGRTQAAQSPEAVGAPPDRDLEFFNGLGGFAEDGREYCTVLGAGQWTPAPWINVIANAGFGSLVSESGVGCTWSTNSQANRLTAWANDPVTDPPSEMFYVRDEDSGHLWSPTPLPIREEGGVYRVRHGQGWTRFAYDAHDLALDLVHFVPVEDPIKVARLRIVNHSPRRRRLSITVYLEWVLGESRSAGAPYVITEIDAATGAMFARNPWNGEFSERIAFADLAGRQISWTADRTEFLGRNGAPDHPAALSGGRALSGRDGANLDPCCALQTTLVISPEEHAEVVFFLGETQDRDQARGLIERYREADLEESMRAVRKQWDDVLTTVQVKTPDRALDLMLNRWLLYQTMACRLWARSALYQSSGAYGFRDQLQDVMALTVSRRDLAREHLLRSAARQFIEGDVQHWWHVPSGRGIRTRVSDDLLWLPYVAAHYLEVTGDQTILEEEAAYLEGQPLAPGQSELYFEPRVSHQRGTLFEHCARAIDRSLSVGIHGLPLMGTGDWNDGMNLVGAGGKGESVWLAWFLSSVLTTWVPLARSRGELARAEAWSHHAAALEQAIENSAWDGEWYRRAFFDDGTPLGSVENDVCAIDSIVQSWSVLAGVGDPERARRAMAALYERLVRREDGVVLLFTPPFDDTALEPGYIKGYLPGIRENGGQYTHAATWAVVAFAMLGDGDKAAELLTMLNPITHTSTPAGMRRYRVEPYSLAGDVYAETPHAGRGGWTWYTGSAGWMYRAGVESLLGFRVMGARLILDPCIPGNWPGFSIAYRHGGTPYDIVVENPSGASKGVLAIEFDGVPLDDLTGISLVDDQQPHRVRVVLG